MLLVLVASATMSVWRAVGIEIPRCLGNCQIEFTRVKHTDSTTSTYRCPLESAENSWCNADEKCMPLLKYNGCIAYPDVKGFSICRHDRSCDMCFYMKICDFHYPLQNHAYLVCLTRNASAMCQDCYKGCHKPSWMEQEIKQIRKAESASLSAARSSSTETSPTTFSTSRRSTTVVQSHDRPEDTQGMSVAGIAAFVAYEVGRHMAVNEQKKVAADPPSVTDSSSLQDMDVTARSPAPPGSDALDGDRCAP